MQFLLTDLRNHKSLTEQESFDAVQLLGTPPDSIRFAHPVKADVKADLLYSEVLVTGKVNTVIDVECSRCLTKFQKSIESQFRQTFSADAEAFDVNEFIRESVLLDLPLKTLCSENCKGLCPNCGANKNVTACKCTPEHHPSSWDALDNIRLQ